MKVQETIRKETVNIALGCTSLTALMLLVFLLIGKLDFPVVLGALIGLAAGVLDFFLLGLTVQKAAEIQAAHPLPKKDTAEDDTDHEDETPQAADPETAALIKRKVQSSYFARRLMLIAVAALGITKWFSLPALVIPMLFPKIVIQFRNLILHLPKGGNNA